ncbi:hypothetical protein O181_064250 [Austropuccinia psidii MF-1]|uniref:DUF7918 domain-containing protein n=1 Tax=Austropuccinia psidii MF-1 TaxID=1389203 RepID=A0A9Q3EK63_9BASI|nr:hypothetical protein [Austropuccinia psidii MF-1]
MPYNQPARVACSIFPVGHSILSNQLPLQEYKHHSVKSSVNNSLQEIVSIESESNITFEIKLFMNSNSYSLLKNHLKKNNHRNPSEVQPLNDNNNTNNNHNNHNNDKDVDPDDDLDDEIPDHDDQDDYLIFIYLDGLCVQRSKRYRHQKGPTLISGVYSKDKKTTRNFQFSKLSLVDPDDERFEPENLKKELCDNEKVIQSLGSIRVDIVRCKLGHPKPIKPSRRKNLIPQIKSANKSKSSIQPSQFDPSFRTSNQMKFSERTKKAAFLSNTAGLGEELPKNIEEKKSSRPVEWKDDHPFLQFIFNYKSRALLEAEGVITPPPPPPARMETLVPSRLSSQSLNQQTHSNKSVDASPPDELTDNHLVTQDDNSVTCLSSMWKSNPRLKVHQNNQNDRSSPECFIVEPPKDKEPKREFIEIDADAEHEKKTIKSESNLKLDDQINQRSRHLGSMENLNDNSKPTKVEHNVNLKTSNLKQEGKNPHDPHPAKKPLIDLDRVGQSSSQRKSQSGFKSENDSSPEKARVKPILDQNDRLVKSEKENANQSISPNQKPSSSLRTKRPSDGAEEDEKKRFKPESEFKKMKVMPTKCGSVMIDLTLDNSDDDDVNWIC